MQCPSCHFENIPGMQRCVRCSSALTFDDVIPVPPRASRTNWATKRRTTWNRFRWMLEVIPSLLSRLPRPGWRPTNWEAIVRSIIPGFGHLHMRLRIQGWVILSVWAVLLVMSVILVGRPAAQFCFSGAIMVHAAAFLTLLAREMVDFGVFSRILVGLAVFIGLQFALYRPARWVARSFYTPLTIVGLLPNDTVADGDTVLYQGRFLAPDAYQRGDLVLYRLEAGDLATTAHIRLDGYGLDRVLAVPGDRIEYTQGRLLVNGQPFVPGRGPLKAFPLVEGYTETLPDYEYFIYPSALELQVHGVPDADKLMLKLSRVSKYLIVGEVVYRIRPWSRFGAVE